MGMILQLGVTLLLWMGARTHVWGKAAAGASRATRGLTMSTTVCDEGDTPPAQMASGEAAM